MREPPETERPPLFEGNPRGFQVSRRSQEVPLHRQSDQDAGPNEFVGDSRQGGQWHRPEEPDQRRSAPTIAVGSIAQLQRHLPRSRTRPQPQRFHACR